MSRYSPRSLCELSPHSVQKKPRADAFTAAKQASKQKLVTGGVNRVGWVKAHMLTGGTGQCTGKLTTSVMCITDKLTGELVGGLNDKCFPSPLVSSIKYLVSYW